MIFKDSQFKPQGGEETLNLIPEITRMEKLQAFLGKESRRGRNLRDGLKAAVLKSQEPKARADWKVRVCIPPPPVTSCRILAKLLNLCYASVHPLENGDKSSSDPRSAIRM